MDPIAKVFSDHVPEFIDAAKMSAPTEEWGRYLLDLFEETFLPMLVPILTKKYAPFIRTEEDVYESVVRAAQDTAEREKIFKAVPPLAEYKEWVLKVIDEAVRLSELEIETPIEVAPTNGAKTPA